MDTKAFDWFEPVETPRGWVFSFRPGDREPVMGFWVSLFSNLAIFVCLIAPGVILLEIFASMGFEWSEASALFFAIPLILLLTGSCLLVVALQKQMGRDELRLDERAIRVARRLGPLSWWKTVRRSKVAQLIVARKPRFLTDGSGLALIQDTYTLWAEDGRGRRRNLVGNYPREALLALAVELSTRWEVLSVDPDLTGGGPKKPAVREESDDPTATRERTSAPPGTGLLFERRGEDGVRITRPADGFLSGGFLGCSFMGVLIFSLAAFLAAPLFLYAKADVSWVWPALLVPCGVYAIVGAVSGAISESVLIATPDFLTFESKGLRRAWRKTWRTSAIRSIRAETRVFHGEGGTEFITRVLIYTTSSIKSEPDELPWSFTKPELEWIATTLRGVLGVPASEAPTDEEIRSGLVAPPSDDSPGAWLRELGD